VYVRVSVCLVLLFWIERTLQRSLSNLLARVKSSELANTRLFHRFLSFSFFFFFFPSFPARTRKVRDCESATIQRSRNRRSRNGLLGFVRRNPDLTRESISRKEFYLNSEAPIFKCRIYICRWFADQRPFKDPKHRKSPSCGKASQARSSDDATTRANENPNFPEFRKNPEIRNVPQSVCSTWSVCDLVVANSIAYVRSVECSLITGRTNNPFCCFRVDELIFLTGGVT